MTNHVHLLAPPKTSDGISRVMQYVGQKYVPYINHTYERSGTLWEGRYKGCLVNHDEYPFTCEVLAKLETKTKNQWVTVRLL